LDESLPHFVFHHAYAELNYRSSERLSFFQYHTRERVIPVCYRIGDASIGILPISSEEPSRSDLFTAGSFLKVYPRSKVILAHTGKRIEELNPRVSLVPVQVMV